MSRADGCGLFFLASNDLYDHYLRSLIQFVDRCIQVIRLDLGPNRIILILIHLSSTYMKIEENADQIWKYQRYNLVHEYVDVPIFPPPVNYLNFVVAAYQRIRSKCSKRPQKLDKHSLHHDLHGYTHNELFHDEDNGKLNRILSF